MHLTTNNIPRQFNISVAKKEYLVNPEEVDFLSWIHELPKGEPHVRWETDIFMWNIEYHILTDV